MLPNNKTQENLSSQKKKIHQNKCSVNNRPLVLLFLRGKCAFGHQFQSDIHL